MDAFNTQLNNIFALTPYSVERKGYFWAHLLYQDTRIRSWYGWGALDKAIETADEMNIAYRNGIIDYVHKRISV